MYDNANFCASKLTHAKNPFELSRVGGRKRGGGRRMVILPCAPLSPHCFSSLAPALSDRIFPGEKLGS